MKKLINLAETLAMLSDDDLAKVGQEKEVEAACKFLVDVENESIRQIKARISQGAADMHKAIMATRSDDDMLVVFKGLIYIRDQIPSLMGLAATEIRRRRSHGK